MDFVIIGAGPAGIQAATDAARAGVNVTLIEREIIGGGSNLKDCIPSKSMIATGGALSYMHRLPGMGITNSSGQVDLDSLRSRINSITEHLTNATTNILKSQRVNLVNGTAKLIDEHTVSAETDSGVETFKADAILISTGSYQRIPEWGQVDGVRILSTRDAYPPRELPSHLIVIGSGVTGVEFVHLFSSLGSRVTLVVSREQVLPLKDAEVSAVLEEDFLARGVKLLKGARAVSVEQTDQHVIVHCDDGRSAKGSHVLFAIGSIPNSKNLGLEEVGVEIASSGYIPINQHCQTNITHIYAAGDVSGKLPLSSVATMQGRKIAEHLLGGRTIAHSHLNYEKAASAIFTEPEIADVGLGEADAFAEGRKIRVTKVPFAASARALINNDSRGFVKIISDPSTGVVLGGSIVGQSAAELISVLAVAVTAGLTVTNIVESMLVHPSLSEALAEAAE